MTEEAEQEKEVLASIFGVDVIAEGLEIDSNVGMFYLTLEIPLEYPSIKPLFNLRIPNIHKKSKQLEWERELIQSIECELEELFIPGEVMLFQFIDKVKEIVFSLPTIDTIHTLPEPLAEIDDVQYEFDSNGYAIIPGCPQIFHSQSPLIEKKSTFVAHAARINTIKEMKLVRKTLYTNKQVKKATHNIAAFRLCHENGVIQQDSDDDGEKAAGARLLNLLQLADIQNVYCVVSRWYGGVQLGPARFKCINNCARQLLVEMGLLQES